MKYLLAVAMLFTFNVSAWDASDYNGGEIEKAHFETQEEWAMVRDSCVAYSNDLVSKFKALGYSDAHIVRVVPYFLQKGVSERHMTVVMNGMVYDNGALSPDPFPESELIIFGDVGKGIELKKRSNFWQG